MPLEQTRYETHHDPQQSPGITRAASVLRKRKRQGAAFDVAWGDALAHVDKGDLAALTWARDVLQDAYENRSGGPLSNLMMEV